MFKNLTFWVLASAVLGYAIATAFGDLNLLNAEQPPFLYELIALAKQLFLGLLKMLVAPIVFFSLISGILNLGNVSRLKSLGSVTIAYYLLTTAIAIAIGLIVVLFIHPWEGTVNPVSLSQITNDGTALSANRMIDLNSGSFIGVLSGFASLAFQNPFSALANLNILGIATNALIIGIALVVVAPKESVIPEIVNTINSALIKILSWVIKIAPFGVFAIVFEMTLKTDGSIIESLAGFVAVVFAATMLHGLVVLPLIAKFAGGVSYFDFFRKAGRPLIVAFSTSSSAATIPVSLRAAQEELKVPQPVASFVIPFGATMNMDGTALFEGIAAIFLAYLFGIELSTTATIAIFLMAMLSSIGAPGMPSGSMAGMQMVLLAAGIPLEAIGILLAVERLLDTFRTAVNVQGDIVGSLVVKRFANNLADKSD
jgi:Na+/H+-dicarboxylate symporter